MKITKIIIAESSPIISNGLTSFFNDLNQIAVTSVVDNVEDLQDKVIVHNPDVLIINPMMLGYMVNAFAKRVITIDGSHIISDGMDGYFGYENK